MQVFFMRAHRTPFHPQLCRQGLIRPACSMAKQEEHFQLHGSKMRYGFQGLWESTSHDAKQRNVTRCCNTHLWVYLIHEYLAWQLHPLMRLFPDRLWQGSPSRRTSDLQEHLRVFLFITSLALMPRSKLPCHPCHSSNPPSVTNTCKPRWTRPALRWCMKCMG